MRTFNTFNGLDLSPCPFCNSPHVVVVTDKDNDYLVECEACAAGGPPEAYSERAIQAWNKRV
jgi:Lar family restriction alleviation protein